MQHRNLQRIGELGHGVDGQVLVASFDSCNVVRADPELFGKLSLSQTARSANFCSSATEVSPHELRSCGAHRPKLG
jgi:hypothetical protein